MLDLIEKAFAHELLLVSHKAAKLMDFVWTIKNIGGVVPITAIQQQFENADEMVEALSKAGVLRYAMGGFINRDQKKQSISVTVNEDILASLPKDYRRKDFENAVYRNHGDKIMPNCRSDLTEPLAVMLTSIIFFANIDKPVFSNTIVRRAAKVCMRSHLECQNILDYYLHRFLGLVTFETGSLVNLSVRSKQRVRMFPKIWEMYARAYQEKPKPEEVRPRLVPQITRPTATPTTKASEQEKKLKGHFPWLKL